MFHKCSNSKPYLNLPFIAAFCQTLPSMPDAASKGECVCVCVYIYVCVYVYVYVYEYVYIYICFEAASGMLGSVGQNAAMNSKFKYGLLFEHL